VTPERFALAIALFHAAVVLLGAIFFERWRRSSRFELPTSRWLGLLATESLVLAVLVYLASLGASLVANATYTAGRVHVGPISLRLLGQALFIELPLLAGLLAATYRRQTRVWRPAFLGIGALTLGAVHVDAYYIEPKMLVPRQYAVDQTQGTIGGPSIRILHLSDIQTPAIGPHEEQALRVGMSYKPDLIVMTGDYVQDALGLETEHQAAKDLRDLMERVGFDAPLGVFATEGDVGPSCHDVFEGTHVKCLPDKSAAVTLPGGQVLSISGLTRGRGRERNPRVLDRILNSVPVADYRIVISHAPDFVDALPRPVDLALAGHTHGGQVVLPLFGPPKTAMRLPRKYAGGLNVFDGTPIHVSRGVGMERGFTIPVRFLCPPEIGIIDLLLPRVR
jgi:uncharacterized protein